MSDTNNQEDPEFGTEQAYETQNKSIQTEGTQTEVQE